MSTSKIQTMKIDKICRACLREDDKMIDMHEKDIYQKFLLFANLTAEEEIPNVPVNLCQSCEQKLNISSLDFKEECKKSHEILLNYIKNTTGMSNAKKPSRLEQFSRYQVLEAIKELKQSFRENKNCIRCSYVGSNLRAMAQHISKVHKELKPRWCFACNGEFDNLTDHVATSHSYEYTCKFCSKKFQKSGYLIEHLRSHSDLKLFHCLFCKKSFVKQSRLDLHLKKHLQMHESEGDLDKETAAFKLKEQKRVRSSKALRKCTFCDKKLKSHNHLIMHERTHTGERPHVCQVCGKNFTQLSTLKTHMMLHNIGPKISCNICNKKFCRPNKLRLHLRRHTGEKPYVCTECGKGFIEKGNLVEHNKIHSDLHPYQCRYCNKSFKYSPSLKRHMWIHSGETPYKCNQCAYACRHSSSLTQHMKKHDLDKPRADRPHVCLMCNSTFTTDAMLMCHINSHNVSFLEI